MAFQGNAFALLDGEDGDILARVSTAAVKAAVAPGAVDKRGGNQKKPMSASNSLLQTSSASQRSSDHEKGRDSRNGNNKQSGNALESQSRNNVKSYNRDGNNRYKKDVGHENCFQQNNRGGTVSKRNNGRPFDGFKRSEGISNGYQKKVEATNGNQKKLVATNGNQKKLVATNGNSNGHQEKEEAGQINGYQKKDNEANGDSNGSQKKQGEEEADDGWQIVVGRTNGHKQRNANHRPASRESNYGLRRGSSNGNLSEVKVFEEKQHSEESGENGVSVDARDVTEYRMNDKLEWNGNMNGPSVEGAAEENENTSEFKELLNEEGLEDDGTSSKGHDKVTSKEELERLEYEKKKQAEWETKNLEQKLEAKKMTLKQYEKQLEEKRKALDSLKTEERKVTLDKDFDSMQVIGKKNEEEANFIQLHSTSDKQKKKGATKKEDNNSQKVKKIVFSPPPSSGRGGRNPRREDDRNGDRSVLEGSKMVPDSRQSVEKPARLPPSFKDDEQFPALG